MLRRQVSASQCQVAMACTGAMPLCTAQMHNFSSSTSQTFRSTDSPTSYGGVGGRAVGTPSSVSPVTPSASTSFSAIEAENAFRDAAHTMHQNRNYFHKNVQPSPSDAPPRPSTFPQRPAAAPSAPSEKLRSFPSEPPPDVMSTTNPHMVAPGTGDLQKTIPMEVEKTESVVEQLAKAVTSFMGNGVLSTEIADQQSFDHIAAWMGISRDALSEYVRQQPSAQATTETTSNAVSCDAAMWVFLVCFNQQKNEAMIYCPFRNKMVTTLRIPKIESTTSKSKKGKKKDVTEKKNTKKKKTESACLATDAFDAIRKLVRAAGGSRRAVFIPIDSPLTYHSTEGNQLDHMQTTNHNVNKLDMRGLTSICDANGFAAFCIATVSDIVASVQLPTAAEKTRRAIRALGEAPESEGQRFLPLSSSCSAVWSFLCHAVNHRDSEAITRGRKSTESSDLSSTSPESAIMDMIAPTYPCYVLHITTGPGSRARQAGTVSLKLREIRTNREIARTGLLEDAFQLFQSEMKNGPITVLMTPGSNHSLAWNIKTLLKKMGMHLLLLQPGAIHVGLQQSRHSSRLDEFIKLCLSAGGFPSLECFQIAMASAAGTMIRERNVLQLGKKAASSNEKPARNTAASLPEFLEQQNSTSNPNLIPPSASPPVTKWLSSLYDNAPRKMQEASTASEMRRRCCMLSIVAGVTEETTYGRRMNPTSSGSHIALMALRDFTSGSVLPPLKVGLRRGELRLPPLDDYDVLVMHHAKNCLLLLAEDPQLRRFIARGGKVWCTAVGSYLLSACQLRDGTGNSLEEVAQEFVDGGCKYITSPFGATARVQRLQPPAFTGAEAVKVIEAKPSRDEEIRVANQDDELREDRGHEDRQSVNSSHGLPTVYAQVADKSLAGRLTTKLERQSAEQALDMLAKTYTKQIDRALDQSQLTSLGHRMEALLAFADMEHNGIAVDSPLVVRMAERVDARSKDIRQALQTMIPEEVPANARRLWSWHHPDHLHAFFFGGTLKFDPSHLQPGTSASDFEENEGVVSVQKLSRSHALSVARMAWSTGRLHRLQQSATVTIAGEAIRSESKDTPQLANNYDLVSKYFGNQQQKCDESHRLIVFDLESTGTDVEKDKIVEMCFMDVRSGTKYSALVRPDNKRRSNAEAQAAHKIPAADIDRAQTFKEQMPALLEFLGIGSDAHSGKSIVLVAHNSIKFDEPLLRREFTEAGLDIDTLRIADSSPCASAAVVFIDSLNVFQMWRDQRNIVNRMVPTAKKNGKRRTLGGAVTSLTLEGVAKSLGVYRMDKKEIKETDYLRSLMHSRSGPAKSEGVPQLHRASADVEMLWNCMQKVSLELLELSSSAGGDSFFKSLERTEDSSQERVVALAQAWLGSAVTAHALHPSRSPFRSPCLLRNGGTGTQQQVEVELPGVAAEYIESDVVHEALRQMHPTEKALLHTLREAGCQAAPLLIEYLAAVERSPFLNTTVNSANQKVPAFVQPDGCVRQDIKLTTTITGRTASAYPNCQSIPKEDKADLRGIFVSRFGRENGVIVEIDYAQLEMVVMALLCQDRHMLKDLDSGVDFHVKRCTALSPETYEQLKKRHLAGDPIVCKMRQTAKLLGFQRLYGAGPQLMADTSGLARIDVEAMLRQEDAEYPGITAFHEFTRDVLFRDHNPGIPTHHVFELPTGCRVAISPRDARGNMPPVKNYPIQSYAAELVQMAVGRLFRELKAKNDFDGRALLINFVHDSVWFDCHKDVIEDLVPLAQRCLGDIRSMLLQQYPGITSNVSFNTTCTVGTDMLSMVSYKKWRSQQLLSSSSS